MTRAIQSVAGVRDVAIDFDRKRATVKSARCTTDEERQIEASLEKAGYGVKSIDKPTS